METGVFLENELFGITHKETIVASPPAGVSALIFCVVDEKFRFYHHFRACRPDEMDDDLFQFMETPARMGENPILHDAIRTRSSVSMTLSYGEDRRKYIYVLPYERKNGRWRFACMQVTPLPSNPDVAERPSVCALGEERMCLVLVDSVHTILSVASRVPESFGHAATDLIGTNLQTLFRTSDFEVLKACSADTMEAILGCVFFCLDGSWREVEIKKFSAADQCTLYGICDVSPRQRMEDFAEVTARERRRIGQDLHDSIGQTLTGMSLLSRSLSNALNRDGHTGGLDASQISELADEASNQIRQISRGLMPSEIVQHGLYKSLRELARNTTETCDVRCETHLDAALEFADVAVETHLYRIAQEAVNNAVRHAGGSRIDIIIAEINGLSQLNVVDDGHWIEPEEKVGGIGLKTMEYRASAIGGLLHIGPSPQGGTQVVCRLENDESLATKV